MSRTSCFINDFRPMTRAAPRHEVAPLGRQMTPALREALTSCRLTWFVTVCVTRAVTDLLDSYPAGLEAAVGSGFLLRGWGAINP